MPDVAVVVEGEHLEGDVAQCERPKGNPRGGAERVEGRSALPYESLFCDGQGESLLMAIRSLCGQGHISQ